MCATIEERMNRIVLLNKMHAARVRLAALLEDLSPEQMTGLMLPGGWSIKDLLAHLGGWEQRTVDRYRAALAGSDALFGVSEAEVDAFNAEMVASLRARDLDAIRAYERDAYQAMLEIAETAPEADLFDPAHFPNGEGVPLWKWMGFNSFWHYDEHIGDLRAVHPAAPLHPAVRSGMAFLAQHGRDIDRAMADFAFRGLPAAAVVDVLAAYQNPDGGFTRLEVDIAAPVSNPFAAELALRVLGWIDPPRDHPVVQRLVQHLEDTQDEDGNWRFAPEVHEGALAPWFQGWKWPNLNPSGQIAGSLKRLGLGSDRLHARVQALFDRLANPAELSTGQFYEVLPYALYFQTEWEHAQAELLRWGVAWWLVRQHVQSGLPEGAQAIDASHFFELAPRPDSPVARRLPENVLSEKLDALLAEQSADGGWPTPYNAGWRPWITANNLLILKAHARV
jgi:hypothetical protein